MIMYIIYILTGTIRVMDAAILVYRSVLESGDFSVSSRLSAKYLLSQSLVAAINPDINNMSILNQNI